MAVERILVVTEVFDYGSGDAPDDARVSVANDTLYIRPHDSNEPVILSFSREEWEQIVNFVRWVWSPATAAVAESLADGSGDSGRD